MVNEIKEMAWKSLEPGTGEPPYDPEVLRRAAPANMVVEPKNKWYLFRDIRPHGEFASRFKRWYVYSDLNVNAYDAIIRYINENLCASSAPVFSCEMPDAYSEVELKLIASDQNSIIIWDKQKEEL